MESVTTSMPRRKVRKNAKQPVISDLDEDGVAPDNNEEAFVDHEVERQSAAIRALRDVEMEQLQTMSRLLCSNFNDEQLQVPVLRFFEENFPNLSIPQTGKDGQNEVKWKDREEILSMNNADGRTLHDSLLHRLSMGYSDYSAGIPSMGGFEFSNKTVKAGFFGADKLQIRSLVMEEPSDSQISELKDSLRTPNVSNNRLSVGITPKTLRLPKCGEVLLSVHGSPLGVFKEDNMETIQETEDG